MHSSPHRARFFDHIDAQETVDLAKSESIVAAINRLPAAHIIGCLRQSATVF